MHDLSPRQQQAFLESTKRINIFEGSTRGGKTFVSMLRWLSYLRHYQGAYTLFLCGKSRSTLKRNIIEPLQNFLGSCVQFKETTNQLYISNHKIDVVGAAEAQSQGRIQGATCGGALVDELTLINKEFFNMLLARMSVPGAQLFATTNPESSGHWVYTDLISRKEELDCTVFSFTMDDNPSLSETYKKQLALEYKATPLFYRRYILGEWCNAENSIYNFDSQLHVISRLPCVHAQEYIVGVDVGTTNPTAFCLIGYDPNSFPNMWLEKEYYYDSKKTGIHKTDFEYAQDFQRFIEFHDIKAIYVDPAALSFITELKRQHVKNVFKAHHDVVPGIKYVAKLLAEGRYKIYNGCRDSIFEYENYAWDPKASERGQDMPIKKHDHALDAQRYALFSHFFHKKTSSLEVAQIRRWERAYRPLV